MELKEFLQKLIDDEYERYVKEAYEETDRIIKENYDNIYINSDDYYDVVTGICFDEIVKNDKKIYGLEYHETDEFTVYSVVELDPMIAFDDKYEECCDNFSIDKLFYDYMIGETGLHIKIYIKEKNIDGIDYVCYSKPILVETEKTIVVKEITLRDVKKFLDDCENDYGITTGMYGNKLEIYRFDGEPIDDDVLIATVNESFGIETSDGNVCPFNDGHGFIEDIENASVRDIVYAILGNIKMSIAEDMSITHESLDCIDNILKSNGFSEVEVTTCNGHKY